VNTIFHTGTIAVYLCLLFVGAAIVPIFFSARMLSSVLIGFNRLETLQRDGFFMPLTLPLVRLGIHPNAITLFGMALVLLLAAGLYDKWPMSALFSIGFFAAISDMFDGMLARAAHKVTALGGAMDGARDGMLFLVLLAGVFSLWDTALLAYLLVGVLLIECLKVCEIFVRARRYGMRLAIVLRSRGQGKVSVDRVKFFLFCAASLGFLFEMGIFGSPVGIGTFLLAACVLTIAVSVVVHAAIIVLELRGKSFMMNEHI